MTIALIIQLCAAEDKTSVIDKCQGFLGSVRKTNNNNNNKKKHFHSFPLGDKTDKYHRLGQTH